MADPLPLAEPDPQLTERADAARNRRRIMEAAARLVDARGIDAVSMHDVAAEAGVGAGTLYRRFGDRAGLALALLDEETREFQNALISGPPPLGPGVPPAERLGAFGEGYLDLLSRHADVLLVGETLRRGGRGPYGFYATHVALLVRQAAPELDAEFTAHALLSALAPGLHLHLSHDLEWPEERVRAGWRALVAGIVGAPG